MNTIAPKFICELYPRSAHRWPQWLAFREHAKTAMASWQTARQWFDSLGGYGDTAVRCGMHSTSGCTTKHPFPWASASLLTSDYGGDHIMLDVEQHDSDYKTVCDIHND